MNIGIFFYYTIKFKQSLVLKLDFFCCAVSRGTACVREVP